MVEKFAKVIMYKINNTVRQIERGEQLLTQIWSMNRVILCWREFRL